MASQFIISLDFELLWGLRDHATRESYGVNILGARRAIPRLLELFTARGIHATWATVGFLFCESKDELIESLPDTRPAYANPALSNYSYLAEVGRNEATDPYYFAPSLIEMIRQTPGQEIGTHALSHYYCLERGQTLATFEADLKTARTLAARRKIELRSIVFPRNQFATGHLEICRKLGFKAYRGNPESWAYRAAKSDDQTALRRVLRLADAYTGVLGAQTFGRSTASPANVPASRFLRPRVGKLARFHPRHVGVIKREMTVAAKSGAGYHLWWHPHNFGRDLEANLDGLRDILGHFRFLAERGWMESTAMADATCV